MHADRHSNPANLLIYCANVLRNGREYFECGNGGNIPDRIEVGRSNSRTVRTVKQVHIQKKTCFCFFLILIDVGPCRCAFR